jgi:hypothetical protein
MKNMKNYFATFILMVLLIISPLSNLNSYASASDLFISEIAFAGSTSSDNCKPTTGTSTFTCSHDKWVEIYNPTQTTINLSNYTISFGRKANGGFTNNQIPLVGSIAPDGYFILGNNNVSTTTNLPTFQQSISNLQFISKNTDNDKYVKIQLEKNGLATSTVNIDNGTIDSFNQNQIPSRFTIVNTDGTFQPNLSSRYGKDNQSFGNPGYGNYVFIPEIKKPEPVINIATATAEIPPTVTANLAFATETAMTAEVTTQTALSPIQQPDPTVTANLVFAVAKETTATTAPDPQIQTSKTETLTPTTLPVTANFTFAAEVINNIVTEQLTPAIPIIPQSTTNISTPTVLTSNRMQDSLFYFAMLMGVYISYFSFRYLLDNLHEFKAGFSYTQDIV